MTTTTQVTSPTTKPAWTLDAVRDLGATVDIATAGRILGIGRSKSYELAKTGQFPVRVLRIGRRYIVPTAGLLAMLTTDS